PEEMGLLPDGGLVEVREAVARPQKRRYAKRTGADNVEWRRREALRTPVFWLIASTFGVAQIGVTGLNLHVFSYVTDLGHPTLVATLFSVCCPPFFGLLFDYTEIYYLSFSIFIGMLFTSAVLSLCLRPPTKRPGLAA